MKKNISNDNLPFGGGISVIVPVFCSQSSLEIFYDRISMELNRINDDWELILVDDCSSDKSWNILTDLHNMDHRVKCIRLARNHGQQHATLCGLGFATKSFVITIDDDLQFFPEDIPLFIEMLKSGYRAVFGGIISGKKQHQWWRNFASNVNQNLLFKIINNPEKIRLSSFRAMTLDVAKNLTIYKGAHPHITAMLFKQVPHNYICNVDVRHAPRFDGKKSTYSLRKLVKTLSYLLINHSYMPLRFMVWWGITISTISICFALWVLFRKLIGSYSQPGWATLTILVSFLSGNILLALGILGEYVGRLVEDATNSQQFLIFEKRM